MDPPPATAEDDDINVLPDYLGMAQQSRVLLHADVNSRDSSDLAENNFFLCAHTE